MGRRCTTILLTLLLGTLHGCDVFRTGTPESPGNVAAYPQATSTDNVLEIIAIATTHKDNLAYLERLTDDFVFLPDDLQRESDAFRTFPDPWEKRQEDSFLGALFSNIDSLGVEWAGAVAQFTGDDAEVAADYTLTAWKTAQPATIYRGQTVMAMRQVAGNWYIHTWSDVALANTTSTWGLLRAQLLAGG